MPRYRQLQFIATLTYKSIRGFERGNLLGVMLLRFNEKQAVLRIIRLETNDGQNASYDKKLFEDYVFCLATKRKDMRGNICKQINDVSR